MRIALACIAMLLGLQAAQADDAGDAIWAYRHGRYEEAASILKPLARAGDPVAQFDIAVMYDDGVGLPRNLPLALQWYVRAAEAGLVDAQYMAGRFYGRGRGTGQNPARALFWFELARAGGHPLAGKLRDQHWSQLSHSRRDEIEAEATRWQSAHPNQFTCKGQPCLYPRWTPIPHWSVFDQENGPE